MIGRPADKAFVSPQWHNTCVVVIASSVGVVKLYLPKVIRKSSICYVFQASGKQLMNSSGGIPENICLRIVNVHIRQCFAGGCNHFDYQ